LEAKVLIDPDRPIHRSGSWPSSVCRTAGGSGQGIRRFEISTPVVATTSCPTHQEDDRGKEEWPIDLLLQHYTENIQLRVILLLLDRSVRVLLVPNASVLLNQPVASSLTSQ
jgi:hypothetical protein